jgi:phosphoglycolate phosphatase
MIRAVLFDFDGTLVDSYPAIAASVNHVRAEHGLPPLEDSVVRRFVGRGPENLLRHTVPNADLPRDVLLYRAHHPTVLRTGTRLLPGAVDAIAGLRQLGLRIAVCSNKPREFTGQLLEYLGLSRAVELYLGPEDVLKPKPAPDMLLAALHRLKLRPDEALYLGDMTVDIETARAARVSVWVVPTGSDDLPTLETAKPDRVLRDLGELPRALGLLSER